MKILAPIDGSDSSFRALRFASKLAKRFDGSLHVVHISEVENEATEKIQRRANEILEEEDVTDSPEIASDITLEFRPSNRVGEDILTLVEEEGYDHVVMGHHGSGTVERAILGSTTETVIRSDKVPATVVP
ncbi:MAG: universal stress protein [Halobacteriaceae archaeon]